MRRDERDVIKLYSSLSGIMRAATGGDMLNFGFWDEAHNSPLLAQKNMCAIFGRLARLEPGQRVIDVGGGFATPASLWRAEYSPIEITSVDLNLEHLRNSSPSQYAVGQQTDKIILVNATARLLPFGDETMDRVLALESAQHFKPLGDFLSESFRVLKKGGFLAMAIPVMEKPTSITKLGSLAITWSSEHYGVDYVESAIRQHGFDIVSLERIGSSVYGPLASYYERNRELLKPKIVAKYPTFVERILLNSLKKMKQVSDDKVIEYVLIFCKK